MNKSVPLYERIHRRCSEEEHHYLDLQASATTASDGIHLLELAERIAGYMAANLVGHRVVICLDQCSTFLPVFWGCLRAGLTAIPVTLVASGGRVSGRELEELRQLLEQATPVAVVVDEASAFLQNIHPVSSLAVWIPFSRLITGAVPPRTVGQRNADVAFALQTSGTTGECKYAAFSGDWYDYEVSTTRRVLTLFPLGSSTGIGYAYALSRLSAYLPLREAVRDPDRLFAAIETYRIEVVVMPPVMVAVLLRYFTASSAPLPRRDLSSLIKLNIGSSTIPLEAVDRLDQLLRLWAAPEGVIHFAYGLTETGGVAYGPYRGLAKHRHLHGLRIGSVSPHVQVQIHAEAAGLPGPISVLRPFTFLGYLGGKDSAGWELSPFESGVDWFETGDLGLVDGDNLVLTGREKDTIVLNSRKTSLAVIEQFVTEAAPDLFETVVACAAHGEALVLFVVLSHEVNSLPLDQLQATVAQSIQRQFGVPLTRIIVREANDIPRTATGKVRKADLVESLAHEGQGAGEVDLPSQRQDKASVEQQLLLAIRQQASVFRSADGEQPISTFGIDSLALAEIIGGVERSCGVRCRLEDCPADPTILQLADLFSGPEVSFDRSQIQPQVPQQVGPRSMDLGRFPRRPALVHRIQAANLQLGGEALSPERVVRRFNGAASGVPLVLVGGLAGSWVSGLARELPAHPVYYLRVLHDYSSHANQDYLTCCYLDWLEACLPQCRPVVVGFCLAGRLALDLSRQMWCRQRMPRLTVLMDWNLGRYKRADPYSGRVAYHINGRSQALSTQSRREIRAELEAITPHTLMTYWAAQSDQSGYIDWDATQLILIKMLAHQAVQQVLAAS